MEDTHGVVNRGTKLDTLVLILIIMEDTHGDLVVRQYQTEDGRLNPYYNGRYSWRD